MSPITAELQITPLLHRWRDGDSTALDELLPLVHHQLSQIARKHLRGERAGHTFATGDLVNEAYCNLFGQGHGNWENRVHFFAVAARAMRNILINYAESRNTKKRGGSDFQRAVVELNELSDKPADVLNGLDQAIDRLAKRDARVAQIVDLYYFCGFTIEEVAEVLPVSTATIKRKLKLAKQWLDLYLQ